MRPSTLYYKLVRKIYAWGIRPKPGNPFYAKALDEQAALLGKKSFR